ncbi:ethylbenzene dehydrogenase-related protein [Variovorax sp. LjRoot84]|uniref:ethylbenzene dehydrogenase-related protein n=1 Tax=Variovorax sp. LjRoot84 TaxID=3342340 RepID=UPI003ECFA48B
MHIAKTRPRVDWPTMLLHWGLVAALVISVSTGWRIASLSQTTPVLRWVDALLVQGNVLHWHFVSASALVALVVGYVAFLWGARLGGRLKLRLASLRSADRTTRWQAVNRLVYWFAFALLTGAAVTGMLLYFFPGKLPTEPLALVHQGLSWAFVAYVVLHVIAQVILGGLRQLLKIVTPRLAYGLGAGLALSAGLAGAAVSYMADLSSVPQLVLAKTPTAPTLDGDAADEVWKRTTEAVVHTSRGFGLRGGEVDVHVRALHHDKHAYFLFRWADETRSQKHIPLIKTEQGWKLLQTNYDKNDENDYYEDKFAVMLARSPVAAGDTVRLGTKPLADKPAPSNGLGLHAATDGSLADVWHWKSVRSGATNQFDDNYFGAPMEAKPGARYTGGYTTDPKTGGGFEQNFDKIKDSAFVKPKFLPKDLAAQQKRMGRFDPNPNLGDDGVYAMHQSEVAAWSADLDAAIPVGTVVPSVVYDKPLGGDRGDVTAHAQWKDGWWTLEAKRALDTGSKFDLPIADDLFMWFAVFDHNQVRHTRHMQPLRLTLQ